MKKKPSKGASHTAQFAVFAGLASLAAAYFFLGPDGKKHQKQAKTWVVKMKKDVVKKLQMVKEMSKPVYYEIIETVAEEYKKKIKTGHPEIDTLAQELKSHWKTLSAHSRQKKNAHKS